MSFIRRTFVEGITNRDVRKATAQRFFDHWEKETVSIFLPVGVIYWLIQKDNKCMQGVEKVSCQNETPESKQPAEQKNINNHRAYPSTNFRINQKR